MSQVQNLLDLFQKNHRDAQAPSADGKAAPKAAPAKPGRGGGDLLPLGTDAKGNAGATQAHSSFRDRMEKSAARLASKERPPKTREGAQNHGAPSRPAGPRPKPEAAGVREESHRQAQGPGESRSGHAERDERPGRADARPGAEKASGQARRPDPDATAAAEAQAGARPQAAATAPAEGDDGLSREDAEAIQAGLGQLGIQVDDTQLEDPAFLMEILRLLQAMPMQALPEDGGNPAEAQSGMLAGAATAEAAGAAPSGAAPETVPAAPVDAEGPSPENAGTDPVAPEANAQGEAPKNLSRKELARLLEGRIAGLERASQAQGAHAPEAARSPAVTPREWQGVQARAHSEGPSPDPLPMADLDRLRVLQAAAAQSAPAQGQATAPQTDFALESDSIEPASPSAAPAASETAQESSGSPRQDAQPDPNGGKGEDGFGAGAAAGPREGALAAKGAEAGNQFHQILDQARGGEHRPAIAAGAQARAEAHGAAMLDQIARKLASSARKPGDEISIQLSPEHLGKVRVSLEMKEEGMSARIAVENDSVRKQVESNLAALKDALRDQGIQLQGMEVSVDQRHSSLFNPDGSNAESFFHRRGRGEDGGRGGRSDEPAALDNAPESDTGRRWGYNTMEYIG